MDRVQITEKALVSFEPLIDIIATAAAGLDARTPNFADNYHKQRKAIVDMLSAVATRAYDLGFKDGQEFKSQTGIGSGEVL